jgi:type II secretory pathway component PulJ
MQALLGLVVSIAMLAAIIGYTVAVLRKLNRLNEEARQAYHRQRQPPALIRQPGRVEV